jgi:hypothetical protein
MKVLIDWESYTLYHITKLGTIELSNQKLPKRKATNEFLDCLGSKNTLFQKYIAYQTNTMMGYFFLRDINRCRKDLIP